MKQIEIGTCIPGDKAEEWLPVMAKVGFECVAINFHMSLGGVDLKELAEKIRPILDSTGVRVAALGYYCNPLQNIEQKKTLEYCIDSAEYLGAPIVSTFAGAYAGESVEAAIPRYKEVFLELSKRAADKNLKIAIENCPMGGTWRNATCNIAFNPRAWDMMFNEVTAENIGLEWEPGHQSIQLIDPIAQLNEWAPTGKIFHMHGKDCSIDHAAISRYGILGATPFALQRTPGFGDTDWRSIFSILHHVGYESDICVEGYHDPIYNNDWELTGQIHAFKYLSWCRGGEFVPMLSETE